MSFPKSARGASKAILSEYWAGGRPQDVWVENGIAYIALGHQGLKIANMTDPNNIVELGRLDAGSTKYGIANNLFVVGTTVYLADDLDGLHVIDAIDPTNPHKIASIRAFERAHDVCVEDGYAYICGGWGWIAVYSVSKPERPTRVGELKGGTDSGRGRHLDYENGYIYVATDEHELQIFDVRNKVTPKLVSRYILPGNSTTAVNVDNELAFVSFGTANMTILNVTDPTNPVKVGEIGEHGPVSVNGDLLYTCWNGVRVYNISDLEHPVLLSSTPFVTGAASDSQIYLSGNCLYITNSFRGVGAMNVTDPVHPVDLGCLVDAGGAGDVVVGNDIAYLAAGNDGLHIINVSAPTNPVKIARWRNESRDYLSINSLILSGSLLYVGCDSFYAPFYDSTEILNVGIPGKPTRIANITNGTVKCIYGELAYVAAQDGLMVYNLSQTTNPNWAGFFNTSQVWTPYMSLEIIDVERVGSYAYLAAGGSGLVILNVSDPKDITFVKQLGDERNSSVEIQLKGNYAYVCDGMDEMEVFDISNPADPVEVARYDSGAHDGGDSARDLFVVGDVAYLAVNQEGVRLINISDPRNPNTIITHDDDGYATMVFATATHLYVLESGGRMVIVDPALVGQYYPDAGWLDLLPYIVIIGVIAGIVGVIIFLVKRRVGG